MPRPFWPSQNTRSMWVINSASRIALAEAGRFSEA
jgi:hypothetical protein